jgi:hypothetical protein
LAGEVRKSSKFPLPTLCSDFQRNKKCVMSVFAGKGRHHAHPHKRFGFKCGRVEAC